MKSSLRNGNILIGLAILLFAIMVLLVIVLPPCFYRSNFGVALSNKEQDWSYFGSFMSGTAGLGLNFINLCIGVCILWFIHHYRFQEAMAFDLHKEWMEMQKTRGQGDAFINKYAGESLEVHYKAKTKGLRPIWQVLSFFERLEIAIEHGRISEDLFIRLFGQIFTWWYIVCFSGCLRSIDYYQKHEKTKEDIKLYEESAINLVSTWTSTQSIVRLNMRLYKRIGKDTRIESWRKIAYDDLKDKITTKPMGWTLLSCEDAISRLKPATKETFEEVRTFYRIVLGWNISAETTSVEWKDKAHRFLGRLAYSCPISGVMKTAFYWENLTEAAQRYEEIGREPKWLPDSKTAAYVMLTDPIGNEFVIWDKRCSTGTMVPVSPAKTKTMVELELKGTDGKELTFTVVRAKAEVNDITPNG